MRFYIMAFVGWDGSDASALARCDWPAIPIGVRDLERSLSPEGRN